VKVRPARLDDLYDLVQASIGVARESEGLEADSDVLRDSIHEALQDPHKARYFVAEDDGRIVGSLFVTFEWSDWTGGWYWWIQGAYVRPEHRRQGVFAALYEAVRQAAAREGDVRRIRLYVERDNEAGLRTYRGLGMEETHYRIFDAPVGK
jgi:GNAT superfamily N-acetyltransferase